MARAIRSGSLEEDSHGACLSACRSHPLAALAGGRSERLTAEQDRFRLAHFLRCDLHNWNYFAIGVDCPAAPDHNCAHCKGTLPKFHSERFVMLRRGTLVCSLLSIVLALLTTNTSCGGGGSGSTSNNSTSTTLAAGAEGVYSGVLSDGESLLMIVLPNGTFYGAMGTMSGNVFYVSGMLTGQPALPRPAPPRHNRTG